MRADGQSDDAGHCAGRSACKFAIIFFAPHSIPLDRRHYSIEHVLITKRFCQEIDRSSRRTE
jgi:hypothetical protein